MSIMTVVGAGVLYYAEHGPSIIIRRECMSLTNNVSNANERILHWGI